MADVLEALSPIWEAWPSPCHAGIEENRPKDGGSCSDSPSWSLCLSNTFLESINIAKWFKKKKGVGATRADDTHS